MPILRKEDALPQRPVVILLYGEPGIGKTSLFNTSANPLLIDFDRGKDRAIFRQDTLVVNTWEDVQSEEKAGTFKDYSTIGIDTAKAALDDFLLSWAVKQDYKNAKNKLAAYGAIGDEFKIFVNNRRSENADLVIIAHSKDEKDGDVLKKYPDVTGGSYQLLLRISDQIGYMSMKNNKRTILFEPTDQTVGKNVARLPLIEIPLESDASIKTFMASIIVKVKSSINAKSEAQQEVLQKSETFRAAIEKATSFDDLTLVVTAIAEQPEYLQKQLLQVLYPKAHSFIPEVKTVDALNNALAFFRTKPVVLTKPIHAELKKVQDEHHWKFDTAKYQFYDPSPSQPQMKDELADRIPGESITASNGTIAEGKEQELAFN